MVKLSTKNNDFKMSQNIMSAIPRQRNVIGEAHIHTHFVVVVC